MTKKRIYIAGPMAGRPQLNIPTFNLAAQLIRADVDLCESWEAVNPVEIGQAIGTDEEITKSPELLKTLMEFERAVVRKCDAILLLNGWEKSAGTRAELRVALDGDIEVYSETMPGPFRGVFKILAEQRTPVDASGKPIVETAKIVDIVAEARDKYTVHECSECNFRKCCELHFDDAGCAEKRQSIALLLGVDDGFFSSFLDRIEAAALRAAALMVKMRNALEDIAAYHNDRDKMDDPDCADGHILGYLAEEVLAAIKEGGAQ